MQQSSARYAACAILLFTSGCASMFVKTPPAGQAPISNPFTLQAQKSESAFCSYRPNTFRAFIDQGQPTELDITAAFVRPSTSHVWTAQDYLLPTGTRTLYVEGRFSGALCLRSKASATRQLVVATPRLPDLAISELRSTPTSPSTADPTTVTFVVANQGGATSGPTVASILRDGSAVGTVDVPSLAAGGRAELSRAIPFPTAAAYTVAANVDPNDTIAEISNANNDATIDITVRACGSTDARAALEAARERIERGDAAADLDGDCRDEYTREFDADGREIREGIDENGDGVPEIVWDKSQATRTYRVDANQDGIAELEVTATPNTSNPDLVTYVRTWDEGGDGVPDRRERYTVDPTQPTFQVRHESDADQDGSFDLEYTSEANTSQDSFYDVVTSGPAACSPAQAAAIDSAFYDAWHDGTDCLRKMDTRMAMTFLRNMGRHTFEISCDASLPATTCARAPDWHTMDSFFGPPERLRIQMNPTSGFDGSCGSTAEVIFHELMHYGLGRHLIGNGRGDPGDRVYACAQTCFGAANSITCAACLGKSNGASECSAYPQVACPSAVPAVCNCGAGKGRIFPDELTCLAPANCPTSLGCFINQCTELGPCR